MADSGVVYGIEPWFADILGRFDVIKESVFAPEEYATISMFSPRTMENFDWDEVEPSNRITFMHQTLRGIDQNYKNALYEFKSNVEAYINEKLNSSEGKSVLFIREHPSFEIKDDKVVISCRISAGRIPNG